VLTPFCQYLGFDLVRIPDLHDPDSIHAAFASMVKEVTDIQVKFTEMTSRGTTPTDQQLISAQILREIAEAQSALSKLSSVCAEMIQNREKDISGAI
jgi:hypothetical protein